MKQAIPQDAPLLPNGRFATSWQRFFIGLNSAGTGSVSTVSITPANGISGTVTNPTTTPAISLSLGNITPTQVASTGQVTGTNLSGTNTGDQTITLTGDVTGSGTGAFAATVGKIGGNAVSLAGSLTTSGAFASTFTMTGVTAVTFPTSGTLATVNATMAGAGTVTQATSKTTGVSLNAITGVITMNAAALASGVAATFTLTNSSIAASDLVLSQIVSGNASPATYQVWTEAVAPGSVKFNVKNVSAGALSEALVISYALVKSVTA